MVSGANAEKVDDHSVGALAQVRTSTRGGQPACRMLEMRGRDQRAFVDGVNDAAGAEKRLEIDLADRRRVAAVVQRRIGVRPKVRRQRDGAHVHRAAGSDLQPSSAADRSCRPETPAWMPKIGGEMSQRVRMQETR